MSIYQHYNLASKGDIIINPKTQRPIRVGSRTWLNLVKQGIVEGRYKDPRELDEYMKNNNLLRKSKKRYVKLING